MIKTCGTCAAMIDDGDDCQYCAWHDLYDFVTPETVGCENWRSKDNKLCVGLAQNHADGNRRISNAD